MPREFSDKEHIRLMRKMVNWGWYQDPITKAVFIHLLLLANWHDSEWKGIKLRRGQLITSYGNIADNNGISYEQARTAVKHLETTHEITHTITYVEGRKTLVFTVVKYNDYQFASHKDSHNDSQLKPNRHKNIKNKAVANAPAPLSKEEMRELGLIDGGDFDE